MGIAFQAAGKTDVGCVRKNNEDAFGYDAENGVFVVCDGVGGQAAGEVASQMGVETVLEYFDQARRNGEYPLVGRRFDGVSPQANALGSAIQLANERIRRVSSVEPEHAGLGSTIVAGLVRDSAVAIAHVGDSRIYLIRDGAIQQLTRDHSFVMEQVARGIISHEEAEHSPAQNFILRALGAEETVEPDLADVDARPGDTLLLSSDGLTRHVTPAQIADIVKAAPTLEQACDSLIQTAKAGGGSDNITCVLVRLEEQPWYQKRFPGNGNSEPAPE